MKVSLRWLKEFVDVPTDDPDELESALASIGHEVEGFEVLTPGFRGVVVGKVESIEAHPDADRIRVCQVDVGDEHLEIICGAWNFETGDIVPVAVPGAELGEDSTITRRKIRGITSNGMICSSKELGLGDDHEGIMVLDPSLPIGDDFSRFVGLPDVVFDVTITPNRPDAMSMWGLARDLAALWRADLRVPEVGVTDSDTPMDVSVEIIDPAGCRRFVGRQMDGIEVKESPLWMQLRLERAGVRAINNVVDVSNYVMLELGQPTHMFDRAKIEGDALIIRWAEEGERLVTLDGVDRVLTELDLVVADAAKPSALAGTMGGEDSEVSDETTAVFIEGASWNPPTVLHMSRRHSLRSEASARFERNVDPNLGELAVDRVAQLVLATAGGTVRRGRADEYPVVAAPWTVTLNVAEVSRLLGVDIAHATVRDHLNALELETVGDDELIVTVPTFRPDLTRPIDLIEEVARLYGFDEIPETLPLGTGGGLSIEDRRLRSLRFALRSAGFHEAVTLSFHGHEELEMLSLRDDDVRRNAIQVTNPLRDEESLLRTTLLVGLLKTLRFNVSHGMSDVALFEIGRVFFNDETPELGIVPHQPVQVAFAAVGSLQSAGMDGGARPLDIYTATAVCRHIAQQLGLSGLNVHQIEISGLHPGRSAEIRYDNAPVGFVGEVHPAAARAFGLSGRVIVGEFDVQQLIADPGLWQFKEPSVFPPVEFDLSFDVPDDLQGARMVAVAQEAAGLLAESTQIFDEFLAGRARSLAIRMRLRAPDRTLTSEEVAPVRQAVIDAIERVGATLKGA